MNNKTLRWCATLVAISVASAYLWHRLADAEKPGVQRISGPAVVASAAPVVVAARSPSVTPEPMDRAIRTVLPGDDGRRQRQIASLIRRFPAGLLTEGQLAMRASHVQRALEVAREVALCLYNQEVQSTFEQQGMHAQLAKLRAGDDPAERARVEAFCQTSGPQAQQLMQQLAMLGVRQGVPESVHWAYDAGLDPSGTAGRLTGRWALAGTDFIALGRALAVSDPERLGLTMADVQVIRKASALLVETPEYANRQAFRSLLESSEALAAKQGAGGTPGHFADLILPAADEQRARELVEAMVLRRRQQLAQVKG